MRQPRLIHATRFLSLYEQDGWFFAQRPQAKAVVGVVPVTAADELVLIEQFRVPVQSRVIELPAGLVGDEQADEDPALAAGRELEEETGFRAAEMRFLTTGPSSAGLTSEMITLYLATGLERIGAGGGVADERITVHVVPLATIHQWLDERRRAGALIDTRIYAGLAFIARHRAGSLP